MAEQVEEKVIFTGDASSLQNAFNTLINDISRTREELKQYKGDKEKTAELTKQLADQEKQLVDVMKKSNNTIDASNVSYRQLNDILKDLNKTYKDTADEAQRLDLAPSIKAINTELKGMDASIGNFQRRVGDYENSITSAADSMSRSFVSLARTLPSLANGPEQFFMQLAQQLPNIVNAYKDLKSAREDSAAAASQDATAHRAEAGEAAESTQAHEAETTAVLQSAGSHLAEAEALRDSAKAELEQARATVVAAQAKKNDLALTQARVQALMAEVASKINLNGTDQELIVNLETLNKLKAQDSQLTIDLAAATAELTAAEIGLTNAEQKLAAAEKVVEEQRKMQTAGGALKGLIKTLFSWQTAILAVILVLAIFGKDILKWAKNLKIFNTEARQAARFQKEWNQEMQEGHRNAAKQLVDLQIYAKWATMASKSDKERTIAAKEVLKAMNSATTEINIAKVKNGEFKESIDEVTKSLIKQAQAEAMTAKITERYKEVIDAMDDVANAKNGNIDAQGQVGMMGATIYSPTAGIGSMPTPQQTEQAMQNAIDGSIKRAEDRLETVKKGFESWFNKFTEEFNPSELLFGKGGSGGKGDNWFSKWELYIKEFEATLIKFQGEYEELDFASIWKYSAEGLKYYTKMYDEYIEHYSADEKALREAQVNKMNYINEFNEYHKKLQKQYLDSLKTEKQVELDKLEEWYTVQVETYKNAGEDTTALETEYTRRKQDIFDKYIDKYKNALLEKAALDKALAGDAAEFNAKMLEFELANLKDTMDKEIKEYERKGIETKYLEEHYAQERKKIVSKYAKEEADSVIAQIEREREARKSYNELSYQNKRRGGKYEGVENVYAMMGGTVMSGIGERRDDIKALEQELKIFVETKNAEIAKMQEVLASDKLIGQERLDMEARLAEAEKELTLGVYEYQAAIAEKRQQKFREDTDEILGYVSSGFNGLAGIFDNVYTAMERMTEARVKNGEISQEEAEKQLEEYKGVQAAAAAMSAIAGAVDSYRSLAGIPIVGVPLGLAAAAAALAAGFAQVSLIKATTKDNAGMGSNSYANAMPSLSNYTPQYVTNVTGKDDTDYLANAMSEKPIKAYVVESDVTASQELANKRNNETTW